MRRMEMNCPDCGSSDVAVSLCLADFEYKCHACGKTGDPFDPGAPERALFTSLVGASVLGAGGDHHNLVALKAAAKKMNAMVEKYQDDYTEILDELRNIRSKQVLALLHLMLEGK